MGIFLLIIILAVVYWQWWLPGPKVANDFPFVSSSAFKSFMRIPQAWSEYGAEGLGEYSVHTLWSWPFVFISSLFAKLGLSFILLERFLIMIPFLILGIWAMWKFGEDLKLSNPAKFIAALFYLTNSYILLVLDGGQLTIGLAYAFFPISLLAIKRSIYGSLKNKILAGFSVWVIGFFDFRFIYMLILLCLIYFFYELLFLKGKWSDWIKNWLKTGLISGLIVISLNVYWLIPIIKVPISNDTYSKLIQTDFTSFIYLGHSMLMLAPHWFKNLFGVVTPLRFEFIFITALVFLAPILRPKDKVVGFWLVVAIVSIFLAKGTSDPFGEVYQWLYFNIPGFSLFRDSTKFFFLLSISYAVLIGISVYEILKKVRNFRVVNMIILSLLAFYFIVIISPVWTGKMTGTFSRQPLEKDYQKLYQFLEIDKQFSRIFWIPSIPPLGPLNPKHPSVEAARLVQERPFALGTIGTYETFNFLREAPYMGEIFDVAGIGYVVYPPLDPRRDNLHPDNSLYYYLFSSQLSALPWLDKVEGLTIPLWKVKSKQDKFFVTPNLWWVIGSDSIYSEATQSTKLKLSKNALIFAEEHAGLGPRIDELPQAKIVLYNKTIIDIAATFIKSTSLIFPAKQLDFDPDKSGWWKRGTADLIRWRDFLKTKYGIDNQDFDLGGGWAVGEGNKQLAIDNGQLRNGDILLARVLESTRSGKLKFYYGDQLIGEVETKHKEDTNVRWFEVGEIQKDGGSVIVESEGDINVVNALALLEKDVWENLKNKADGLQNRIVDFDESLPQNSDSKVTYKQINSTKYKVNITNLTKPSFLVFSQTYHPLWKLDDKQSLPIYSLLNGFRIDRNGEHVVEFEPQRYVYPGLVISVVMFSILILLLLRKRS